MPDPSPEHEESPPQWPPPSWHHEPTSDPQTPQVDSVPASDPIAKDEAATPPVFPEEVPSGPPSAETTAPEDPAPAPPVTPAAVPAATPGPPTHGRGVRMAIYGFGGAVVIGLLAIIVVMAGTTLGPQAQDGNTSNALIDDNGEVDPDKYAELAEAAGTDEWVQWRYGEPDEAAEAPSADEPETRQLDTQDGIEHLYQHGDGSSVENPGNVQGQLGYVPDGDAAGVDHVTTVETTDTTAGFTPRPGGRFSADTEDPDLSGDTMTNCEAKGGPGRLVAAQRGHGQGRAAHAVLAFSSGVISTAGISGAQVGTCLQLPDNQVPTAVSLTPGNEFALVTVWDTEQQLGRVAVIAMGDTPATYLASWPKLYPGLPNPGHFSFAKLLGFVDLDSIQAPTSIAAGTNYPGNSSVDRATADLATQQHRDTHAEYAATNGYAVVASGAERTVEWIDLSPLLAGFAATYFEGDPAAFASPGAAADQWPPTFDNNADFVPTVAATTEFETEPTAVANVGRTAYVADQGNNVTAFETKDPADIAEIGSVSLDGPASCLTPTSNGKQLLVTSRQSDSVSWISPSDSGGEVAQTLRDERLEDPVCAVDNPVTTSHGTAIRSVSVADYEGGSLHTFRYGKGQLATGTDLSLSKNTFEYGGAYQPAGKPFAVTVTVDNL